MLEIENYIRAASLDEAYDRLISEKGAVVLGGCGYLRLGGRKIGHAIDLSGLNLTLIEEAGSGLEIGAMVSLRSVETNSVLIGLADGLLPESVKNIVGIQMRSCVTLGGSVAGRYPFSDPITALLALDAELHFHHHGTISLQEYLVGKGLKDILVKITIPGALRNGAFKSIRKSSTDYAVLNLAAVKVNNSHRIVVGSRPGRAQRVGVAEKFLDSEGISEASAAQAGQIVSENLKFGDNPRGSAEYRKAVCPVLVKRALLEILVKEEGCDAA
jgi:CO/xanthine dehydrogenase FAD-binding subunit